MSEPGERFTAFLGTGFLASGSRPQLADRIRDVLANEPDARILVFDDQTGAAVDLDLRGTTTPAETSETGEAPIRKAGRPRLGVASREVTLLPRHWDWLAAQPGGASVTLRKLVEAARRDPEQLRRGARDAAYRVMSAMAGDLAGFEEASRALFNDDFKTMFSHMADWPDDIRDYLRSRLDRTDPAEQAP